MPRCAPLAVAAAVLACACARPPDEIVEVTPGRVARGDYLVNHVAVCGQCHTTRDSGHLGDPERADLPLAGGNVFETVEPHVRVWVPDITPDPETGIGRWTDGELMRSIRDGVGHRGKPLLPMMPYQSYRHLSDEDVRAIVAYLRSVPPLREPRARVPDELPPLARPLAWVGLHLRPAVRGVPEPPRADPPKHGEYLAHAATCSDCHSLGTRGPRDDTNRYLAGSDLPLPDAGAVWAPNLTPDHDTGIGGIRPERVKRSLREPVRLDGQPMAPPMSSLCRHYAGMTEADLDALVAYLFAQRPVRQLVPPRQLKPEVEARLRAQAARGAGR